MGAWLQLPRAAGLCLDVPTGPGLCETCRERPAELGAYCSRLCLVFDAALDELAAARAAAEDDPRADAVVTARTRLRAIAHIYDADRLGTRACRGAPAEWTADVAAGLLLPVPFWLAVAAARAILVAPPA